MDVTDRSPLNAEAVAIREVGMVLDGGTILPGRREFIPFGGWEALVYGVPCQHQHKTQEAAMHCARRLARRVDRAMVETPQ
jgi:hypothetical protein